MLRRNFRIGLLVGLLGGALVAIAKAVQGKSSTAPSVAPAAWTPLADAEPVVVPPKPSAKPPVERPTVRIADLQESPAPAAKAAAPAKKAAAKPPPWVEPVDGEPPASHPVKAKMSSMIYHVPGGFNYARTKADRCYRDAEAAEADGLRPSKR